MLSEQYARVPSRPQRFHPVEYAHIVLRTAQPDKLVEWYGEVLGLQIVLDHPMIKFLTWDDSQDRLAIIPDGSATPAGRNVAGLDHVAFEVSGLSELVSHYRHLKERGIVPTHCVNHGVSTSMYYRDPDDNQIELSVSAFRDVDALNEWLSTGAFDVNPLGVFIDPEELGERVDGDESNDDILRPHPRHRTYLDDLANGRS